jgi:hypothetical protein
LLCSRADLLTDNADLKHERKTKRILGWIFKIGIFIYKDKTMSEDIRKMIDKVKNFKQFVNENTENKTFLGYHSSKRDMKDGLYKASVLNVSDYSDLIRSAYMDIISDYDENLENDDFEEMNNVFNKNGYGFTFVSNEPIKALSYQYDKYKYGDYLYKVFGDGNEILLDDPNEIGATIVVSKKPLYFKQEIK